METAEEMVDLVLVEAPVNRDVVQRTWEDSEAVRMETVECITLSGDELTHHEETLLIEDAKRTMDLKSESHRLEHINQSQVESIGRMNIKLARQRTILREIKTKIYNKEEELRKKDEEMDDIMEVREEQKEIQERKKELLGIQTDLLRDKEIVYYNKLRFSQEIRKMVTINENLKQASEKEKIDSVTREQRAKDEHEEKIRILKENINDAIREKTKNSAEINLLETKISLLDNLNKAKRISQQLKDQSNKKDMEISEMHKNIKEMKSQLNEMKMEVSLPSDPIRANTQVKNLKKRLVTELEDLETCDNLMNDKNKCDTKVMCVSSDTGDTAIMTVHDCKCPSDCIPATCSCIQSDITCGPQCGCAGKCILGSSGTEGLVTLSKNGTGELCCIVTCDVVTGQMLREYTGEIFTRNISRNSRSLVRLNNKLLIDGAKGGSEVTYAKFSHCPNTELCSKFVRVQGGVRPAVLVRAKCDIKSGEEVTINHDLKHSRP